MPEDDYLSGTIRAYDRDPGRYERATAGMLPEAELDAFVRMLPDPAGRVLDVGCAFGRDTGLLAARGLRAQGVDLSAAFVARAAERHPELPFRVMDARRLDFPDGHFAGIWCQATLLHLKDHDVSAALAGFRRVLVPGGALFAGFKEGEGEEEVVERFSSDASRFYRYQSAAGVTALLEGAGFRVAAVERSHEAERYGPGHRDLTWLHAFAHAPGGRGA
ncbi:class I SAM-dependent methyltransferase [Kitasatospora cineracea]|uniref:Methyltransferase family protein n=1 Tax=Kitasatospora cineracea TaxID=88074 RepID=A0A8G1XAD9_9ACTN|nr:class I SAM-dependent methyltransferase [Kitasatospora cineracea]ROR43070.1 methyltransferase family protein [Kitasatospora cineracea]